MMNFLAHLYLASPRGVATGPAMVGNLLPDFVRASHALEFDAAVLAGAQRHRLVDRFTDAHPIFLRSRARLCECGGRYAGILTDVFYDHALSLDWPRYHDLPLADFITAAHGRLASSQAVMPEAMRPVIARMIEEDWLSTYATPEELRLTLTRMSHRLRERFGRDVRLQDAVEHLAQLRPALRDDFHAFFPDVIAVAGET